MILIIQNGYIVPCLPKYLHQEYIIVKSYEKNVATIEIDAYDVVIILGGHQSITKIDKYPYLHNVVDLINKCIAVRKPIFAICLGAQLAAHALGCEIKSSHKINIGYDVDIMDCQNIFRCHVDYIVPNDKITVEKVIDNMPYLYFYQNIIVGIQCHPDLTPECVVKYSNHEQAMQYAKLYNTQIDSNNQSVVNKILNFLTNS